MPVRPMRGLTEWTNESGHRKKWLVPVTKEDAVELAKRAMEEYSRWRLYRLWVVGGYVCVLFVKLQERNEPA